MYTTTRLYDDVQATALLKAQGDAPQICDIGDLTEHVNLTFGYHFDQPIAHGSLPDGLTSLTFGGCFNQPIAPGVLPNGLTSLTFGRAFNRRIAPGDYKTLPMQ
eukprot:gene4118-4808_t